MNTISVLIHGRELKYPFSLEEKCPGNSTGLCNQIFSAINSIHLSNLKQDNLYIDFFSKDWLKGDLLKFSDIIDINKMRSEYGWNIYDVTDFIGGEVRVIPQGYVFMCYHQDKESFKRISRNLIFNQKWEDLSKKIIEKMGLLDEEVNLVHLRIDKDAEDHIVQLRKRECYNSLLESYRDEINKNCDTNKKLVLLMEDIHHPFVSELKEKYEIVYFDKDLVMETYKSLYNDDILDGREMYALVDFLIGKNLKVDTFIGAEGEKFTSSFSVLLKNIKDYNNTIVV